MLENRVNHLIGRIGVLTLAKNVSEQFVVELKLWYGDVAHEEAFEQIAGYLLTFFCPNCGKAGINYKFGVA